MNETLIIILATASGFLGSTSVYWYKKYRNILIKYHKSLQGECEALNNAQIEIEDSNGLRKQLIRRSEELVNALEENQILRMEKQNLFLSIN